MLKPSLTPLQLPTSSEVTYIKFASTAAGELDMTYNQLPIELFQKLKKEIPNERTLTYLCTYYYEINNQKAPFTRRARAYRAEAGSGSRYYC